MFDEGSSIHFAPDLVRELAIIERAKGKYRGAKASQLRVRTMSYCGVQYLEIRLFEQKTGYEMRPTRKRVTVKENEIDKVIAALLDAKSKGRTR